MNLALFDLDNTLLSGDSDFEWAQFLIEQGVLDRELFEAKNLAFYEQYKQGTLDIHEFLDFQLKPLSRHPRSLLDGWHGEFMQRKVRPMMGKPARDLVAQHRAAGDVCVVITATNSFVTAPIAREFGVEHLIATEPEQKDGEFTGGVAGVPSFREGKVERLEDWMAQRGWSWGSFADSWFYSDSQNDLPLLEKVKNPVVRKIFLTSDLNIQTKEDAQTIKNYADALATIQKIYTVNYTVLDILQKFSADENNVDPKILVKLDPIIEQTSKVIHAGIKTSVPQSLSVLHLNVINSLQRLLENMKDIQLYDTDPIVAFGAISQYNQNASILESDMFNLQSAIQQRLNN